MRRVSISVTFVVTAVAVVLFSASPSSQGRRIGRLEVEDIGAREAAAREVLVKFRTPPQPAQLGQLATEADAESMQPVGRTGIVRVLSRTRSAAALIAAFAQRPDVAFAEANYVVRALSEPSDPLFPQLWGLKNIGQPINGGAAGTIGADMRAADAWELSVGSASNVVAIVDTGIDYTHSDLAPNMWSAPAPFTVIIRGVPITCQAGTHGFNAITRTCDPMDDHNHGTHVAGTIGAVGNNANGVTGVNWVTSMMGLKFLDAGGSGTTADAIDLIDFAIQVKQIFAASGGANIRILSNSWGGGDFSQALLDEINAAAAEDMLFVAAAGNNGLPNDIIPMYPASYAAPNVIAVAATTNTDARASFSNYGVKTVHLGAPGASILSTLRGGAYGFQSGTSMATPHVSGAAALTLSHCALNTATLKTALIESVDQIPALLTKTMTGGRLNVLKTLQSCSTPPGVPTNVIASAGDRQIRLSWSTVVGATSYRVKRSTSAGGPYTTVTSNRQNASVHRHRSQQRNHVLLRRVGGELPWRKWPLCGDVGHTEATCGSRGLSPDGAQLCRRRSTSDDIGYNEKSGNRFGRPVDDTLLPIRKHEPGAYRHGADDSAECAAARARRHLIGVAHARNPVNTIARLALRDREGRRR